MPIYQKIPTLQHWESDCVEGDGSSQATPPGQSHAAPTQPDHVLDTIHDLLSEYDSIRDAPKAKKEFRKHLIVAYLHEASHYWLEKGDRAPKIAVGGGAGSPRFTRTGPAGASGAVEALRDVARTKLLKYYDWLKPDDVAGIRRALAGGGVGVLNTEADEDAKRRREGGMSWLESDEDRFGYKLRFREGMAHRVRRSDLESEGVEVAPFTTTYEESELRDRRTHFVMDSRGRIYCGYDRQRARAFKFFHSSLVAGEPALSAGMMTIEGGRVQVIANASGHYRPDGRHMATVLQRLRLYGVPLAGVAVEQHDTKEQFPAEDVLRWNGWPKP